MKYYIGSVYTRKAANAKCAELNREMDKYEGCLVADDVARDALVEEVRQTVKRLNEAYPRTKPLTVKTDRTGVYCHPEPATSDSDTVFSFNLQRVRREYRFAEGNNLLEGGAR